MSEDGAFADRETVRLLHAAANWIAAAIQEDPGGEPWTLTRTLLNELISHVDAIGGLLSDLGIDAVAHRLSGDGHLHHRNCIHNLPPEDQVALLGYTIEKWLAVIGPLPQQITPDEWRVVTDD